MEEVITNKFVSDWWPFSSIQEVIDEALKEKGSGAKVLFLMDGSITVPHI